MIFLILIIKYYLKSYKFFYSYIITVIFIRLIKLYLKKPKKFKFNKNNIYISILQELNRTFKIRI